MAKSFEPTLIKKFFFILIILFLFFLVVELFARAFIFTITKDYKSFFYGLNKNIKVDINHLIKLKVNIIDLKQLNNSVNNFKNNTKNTKDKKKIYWAFGGSTTAGNVCGENSSSWPKIISENSENHIVENFGQNGIDSYISLQIFQKEAIKKKLAEGIFWAHKFNEINVIYQGVKKDPNRLLLDTKNFKKRKYLFKVLTVESTIEKNLLFYKIIKNIIITSHRKIIRGFTQKHINPSLTENDFIFAAKNFEHNTSKAIELSKKMGIKNFYIISMPSTKEYNNKMKDKFFVHYYDSIQNLIKMGNVKFIDLSKKNIFFKEETSLFCDEIHKTLKANILVANFISSFIQH